MDRRRVVCQPFHRVRGDTAEHASCLECCLVYFMLLIPDVPMFWCSGVFLLQFNVSPHGKYIGSGATMDVAAR